MGKLISAGGAMVVYLCVATVLTTTIVFGYLWTHGYLDEGKVNRIVAVVRGMDVVRRRSNKPRRLHNRPSNLRSKTLNGSEASKADKLSFAKKKSTETSKEFDSNNAS